MQHALEAALLGLGQFQPQLEALLQWLSHTAEQLQSAAAPCDDLQSCEVEMAKHRVSARCNAAMHHCQAALSCMAARQLCDAPLPGCSVMHSCEAGL